MVIAILRLIVTFLWAYASLRNKSVTSTRHFANFWNFFGKVTLFGEMTFWPSHVYSPTHFPGLKSSYSCAEHREMTHKRSETLVKSCVELTLVWQSDAYLFKSKFLKKKDFLDFEFRNF